jgi:DNA-binding MarR family transcriptional regulator
VTDDLPDHIGWDLVRAARLWEARFTRAMVATGHPWFGEARGRLIRFVGRDGIAQGRLVTLSGLSKQAVQQQLDALEGDGIICRVPDTGDARRVRIVFTDQGREALATADRIKTGIEAEMAESLGHDGLETLRRLLKTWIGG